eukprot:gene13873-biopygen2723
MAHGRRAWGRLPALARAPGSRGVVPAVSHRCSKGHVRRGVALTLVTAARVSKLETKLYGIRMAGGEGGGEVEQEGRRVSTGGGPTAGTQHISCHPLTPSTTSTAHHALIRTPLAALEGSRAGDTFPVPSLTATRHRGPARHGRAPWPPRAPENRPRFRHAPCMLPGAAATGDGP